MSHIILKDVSINGVNMYDVNRKIWNILRGKKSLPIHILKNINFEAKNGDRIGILGKNGHGKSSLIKVISGIYPPHKGYVDIKGKILSVIEGGSISAMIPGEDAVRMSFIYNNVLDQFSDEILEEILDFAELTEYRKIPPIQYSSGMKVRLAVASTLFQKGEIAIFDEFSAMIDDKFVEKATNRINKIWNDINIGIYISHKIEEIRKFCTTCCVLYKGEIIDHGETEKMIEVYNKL